MAKAKLVEVAISDGLNSYRGDVHPDILEDENRMRDWLSGWLDYWKNMDEIYTGPPSDITWEIYVGDSSDILHKIDI